MGHSVLRQITSRKAFIYALEVFAQLVAVLALAKRLPRDWLAFIDNTASEAALKRGYGNDAFVNGMLATFWTTTRTPSRTSSPERPPTPTAPPARRCTTWRTPSTEPARYGGRGRRAGYEVRPARCLPVLGAERRIAHAKRLHASNVRSSARARAYAGPIFCLLAPALLLELGLELKNNTLARLRTLCTLNRELLPGNERHNAHAPGQTGRLL